MTGTIDVCGAMEILLQKEKAGKFRAPLKTSVRFLEVPGRKPQLFVI